MGSVQNLIGMPSNGYVPKVAVQNTIAIYNFFFKKNIWAKYWWRILCFNHSIHKWFKNIFNHIALPSIWNFTLLYGIQCMLWHWIRDSSALLQLLFYEQFSTVLKPIMTLVAEISARWRCQHTFPDSGRTTFSRFLTALFLQYYLLSSIK